LRPGGALMAATNAESSMLTFLDEIQAAYDALGVPIASLPTPFRKNFSLESGGEFITPYLPHLEIHRLESALVFPEVKPVLAYIHSMHTFYESYLPTQIGWKAVLEQLQKQIEAIILNDGVYRVSKTTGIFIAYKG